MSRLAVVLLLAVALLPGAAVAQPARVATGAETTSSTSALRIQVRGGAELHAVAGADRGELTARGEIIDDAGSPVAGASILVQAFVEGATRAPVRLGRLSPCEGTSARVVARVGDDILIEADDRGGFCVKGQAPDGKLSLKLRFRGTKLHDAAELEVPVEADQDRRERVLLRFEPPPETIDLDRETVTVTASLRVERSDRLRLSVAGSAQRANLTLALHDERRELERVAEAVTGGDGRARFELKTSALDGPGAGQLVVRFAGNAVLAKAEETKPIVRRAEARLALVHPVERADADDGIPIDVEVTTGRGPVSGGVVEVRRRRSPAAPSGESVGAATVDAHGRARIVATFPSAGATQVPLVMRYVPAAPWYRAGPEVRFEVKLAGPSVLRQLLLAAVLIGAAAWIAAGWRRAPRPPALPGVEGAAPALSGCAGVQVLASPPDLSGWRGTVKDAHDGAAIAGARLTIVIPSFTGDGAAAHATSDERGAFTLEGTYQSGARLVVESADHTTHEQPLPPPSVLGVSLVTRRRALLDRLVRWARRKGAPFDVAPEPTPGHVRRVAARTSAHEVESWAASIELAAYGRERVDDARERDLRAGEPRAIAPVKPPEGAL